MEGGIFLHQDKKYVVKCAEIREIDDTWEIRGKVYFKESLLVGIKMKYNRVLEFQEFRVL
jgi:hypothetical protein